MFQSLSSDDFDKLIINAYSQESADRENSINILSKLTTRIDFLPYLYDFLGKFSNSEMHVLYIFSAMKKLIERKGCLMQPEKLYEHFSFLKKGLLGSASAFVQHESLLNAGADALAVTMKHLFENDYCQYGFVNEIVFYIEDNKFEIAQKVVALNVITEFINMFKTRMQYLSELEHYKITESFKSKFVLDFYMIGLNIFLNFDDEKLKTYSLKLMIASLNSFNPMEKENNVCYSNNFDSCYNQNLVSQLFQICMDKQFNELSFKLLYCLLIGSNVLKANKIDFLHFFISNINQCLQNGGFVNHLLMCRIIAGIAAQPNPDLLINIDFLNSVRNYSPQIYSSLEPNLIRYILLFWINISSYQGIEHSFIESIFREYISCTISSIKKNHETALEMFQDLSFDSTEISIWVIPSSYHRLLSEIVKSQIEENKDDILSSTFLIKIITSYFVRKSLNLGNTDYMGALYEIVICFIESTTKEILRFIQEGSNEAIVFETSIIDFISKFQNTELANTRIGHLQNEGERKLYEQNCVALFIRRMGVDLQIFSAIEGSEHLLRIILSCIYDLVKKSKGNLENYFGNFVIPIESRNLNEVKKLRTFLQRTLMLMVNSKEQLNALLERYEQRIKLVSNEKEIIELYLDLKGLIQGAYEGKDNTYKVTTIFNWFLRRYFDFTTRIINEYSTNCHVVNAICNFWISFFPDKYKDNIIKQSSGFGIRLFKSSLNILNGISQSIDNFEYIIKLINYCISTKYANFGVMKFYQDNSFEGMIQLFFKIFISLQYEQLKGYHKILKYILKIIISINKIDTKYIINDDNVLQALSDFTLGCISELDNDIFTLLWESIKPLISDLSETGKLVIFRNHFSAFINAFIVSGETLNNEASEFLLIYFIVDNQYCMSVLDNIYQTFDGAFKDSIIQIFNNLFYGIGQTYNENQKIDFFARIGKFVNSMKRYKFNFID